MLEVNVRGQVPREGETVRMKLHLSEVCGFLGTKPSKRKALHINQAERFTRDGLTPANIWKGHTS